MAKEQLISSMAAASALGVSGRTIKKWVDDGVLKAFPLNPDKTSGKGTRYRFRLHDVFAFAISRHLKAKGFASDHSILAAEWLLSRSLDDLQGEWEQGKHLLFVVGGGIFPQQLSHDQIFSNPAIDIPAALEAAVPIAVVDLREAFQQLCRKLRLEAANAN